MVGVFTVFQELAVLEKAFCFQFLICAFRAKKNWLCGLQSKSLKT